MKNLSYFTANGRIVEMIIFEYETQIFSPGIDPKQQLSHLIAKYRPLATMLNVNRSSTIKINIMFDFDRPNKLKEWEDRDFGLRFIATNSFVSKARIPSSWTQDCIQIVKDAHLNIGYLDDQIISKELAQVFEKCLPNIKWIRISFLNIPVGGNYICLYGSQNEIGIEGGNIFTIDPPGSIEDRAAQMKIEKNNYQKLELERPSNPECKAIQSRVVFHLDQYLTPIGLHHKTMHNLFLTAEIVVAETSKIFDCVSEINDSIKKLPLKLQISNFNPQTDIIVVPLFLLNKDTEPFGFCYNNCVVENFEFNNQRATKIYFPDFRIPAISYLKKHVYYGSQKFKKNLFIEDEIIAGLRKAISYLKNIDYKIDSELTLEDAIMLTIEIIFETEKLIRKKLAHYNIPGENISFVPMEFAKLAERLGSLHCRVKVIERDCLP